MKYRIEENKTTGHMTLTIINPPKTPPPKEQEQTRVTNLPIILQGENGETYAPKIYYGGIVIPKDYKDTIIVETSNTAVARIFRRQKNLDGLKEAMKMWIEHAKKIESL